MVNNRRKGKGRNNSKVYIEVKWREGEKYPAVGSYRRTALGNGSGVTAWEVG